MIMAEKAFRQKGKFSVMTLSKDGKRFLFAPSRQFFRQLLNEVLIPFYIICHPRTNLISAKGSKQQSGISQKSSSSFFINYLLSHFLTKKFRSRKIDLKFPYAFSSTSFFPIHPIFISSSAEEKIKQIKSDLQYIAFFLSNFPCLTSFSFSFLVVRSQIVYFIAFSFPPFSTVWGKKAIDDFCRREDKKSGEEKRKEFNYFLTAGNFIPSERWKWN